MPRVRALQELYGLSRKLSSPGYSTIGARARARDRGGHNRGQRQPASTWSAVRMRVRKRIHMSLNVQM